MSTTTKMASPLTESARLAMLLLVSALFVTSTSAGAQGAQSVQLSPARELFQQAMYEEEASGDAAAAMSLYARAIEAAEADTTLAAEAELRLAHLYARVGRAADAGAHYRNVVASYANDPRLAEFVAAARNGLVTSLPDGTEGAVAIDAVKLAYDGPMQPLSVSPDGNKVAFLDFEVGQNISVFDLTSGQARRVTDSNWTGPPRNPGFYDPPAVWSADGELIAATKGDVRPGDEFVYELRVFDLDGGSKPLYRNGANPGMGVWAAGWLPDGSGVVGVLQNGDKTYTLGVFSSMEQSFRPIESLQWDFDPFSSRPEVSPDGRFVVFEEGEQGATDIHIVSLDGSASTVVSAHPADDKDPVWSPDGSHLVFLSRRLGNYGLWGIAVEDGAPAGEPFLMQEGMEDTELLDWVTTGLVYAKPNWLQDAFILAVDAETGQAVGEPSQIRYPYTGKTESAGWSPDGSRIAFVHDRRNVVVMSADGGRPREFALPNSKDYPREFQWLPDGSAVSFLQPDDREQNTIFKLDVESGELEGWTSPDTIAYPPTFSWTGRGDSIYYVGTSPEPTGQPDNEIREYDLASGVERVLLSKDRANSGMGNGARLWILQRLSTSPDLRSLAFHANRAGADTPPGSTWILDVATGDARQVFPPTPEDSRVGAGPISWSSDSRFVSWGTVAVDINDGAARRFTGLGQDRFSFVDPNARIRRRHWSGDGTRVLVTVQSSRPEVWLIQDAIPAADGADAAGRR